MQSRHSQSRYSRLKPLILSVALIFLAACQYPGAFEETQCSKQSDCSGDAVCVSGYCKLPEQLEDILDPPDTGQPDIEQPDIEQPDIEQPDIEEPDIEEPDAGDSEVRSIVLNGPDELAVGQSQTLSVQLFDGAGQELDPADFTLTWTVYGAGAGSVDQTGRFSALQPGEAFVTVAAGYVTGTLSITVVPAPAARIELSCDTGSGEEACDALGILSPGNEVDVRATVYDEHDNEMEHAELLWESSQPGFALLYDHTTNPHERTLRAIGTGSATITVAALDDPDAVNASFGVVVQAPGQGDPASVEAYPAALTLPGGADFQAAAIAYDADGTKHAGANLTWSIKDATDPDLVDVSGSGLISTQKLGPNGGPQSATVRVEVEGLSGVHADISLIITQSAAVSPSKATLDVGQKITLEALDASLDAPVSATWSSQDDSIAQVNASSGEVTAKKEGTTDIIARVDGVDYSAEITVNALQPARVVIDSTSEQIKIGDEVTFKATVYATNGDEMAESDATVDWTIDASNVATLTDDGPRRVKVTGDARGVATITAKVGSGSSAISAHATLQVVAPVAFPATITTRAEQDVRTTLHGANANGGTDQLKVRLLKKGSDTETENTIQTAEGGSVQLESSSAGTIVYSPPQGFAGTDSFRFVVEDTNLHVFSELVTVSINVHPYARITTEIDEELETIKISGADSIPSGGQCAWDHNLPGGTQFDSGNSSTSNDCAKKITTNEKSGTYSIKLTYTSNSLSDTAEFSVDLQF